MVDLVEKLRPLSERIGADRMETDAAIAAAYAVDGLRPEAVIFPRNTREVAEVVKVAGREHLSVIPWGSGTKMGMGNAPSRVDLVVCSSKMNHMLDVDTANLTITVEAGVKFRDIQARLATEDDRCYLPLEDLTTSQDELICSDRANSGCFLAMDPPFCETATIGGIVAVNSSGPRRLLYRFPRDQLLGARFVSPDGEIIGTGGKTVKNVSGYDISKLMVGSAGSLGYITEMTFRLLPLPEHVETLVLTFTSFDGACDVAEMVLDTTLLPAAVEIINPRACESLPLGDAAGGEAGIYGVAVAMEAFAPAVTRMKKEILDMGRHKGAVGDVAFEEDDHRRFWLRVSHLQESGKPGSSKPISFQLTYPLSRTRDVVFHAEAALAESPMPHTLMVHVGTGGSVVTLSHEVSESEGEKRVIALLDDLRRRCHKEGGNLVVLNAPPAVKGEVPVWGETGNDLSVMKRIKNQLDPSGVFSPGRFVGGL